MTHSPALLALPINERVIGAEKNSFFVRGDALSGVDG
jgi:hypothetical protein